MRSPHRAAIVTVGSELVEGLRIDTNTAEIARALGVRGFSVDEAISIGDDVTKLAETLARLLADHRLVVVTGGLGPTHDDITREAAAAALGRQLVRDERLAAKLEVVARRHRHSVAAEQIFVQALVIAGATVIDATTGTAPGQIITHGDATLALLPGPPSEMRPMLETVLESYPAKRAEPIEIGVVGMGESDGQVLAQAALESHPDTVLTVLARPGDLKVILFDDGAGADGLRRAADDVVAALGDRVYSDTGKALSEVVIAQAISRGLTLGTAESCTGGMVAAELTDVAGASAAFRGTVVSYDNQVKASLLGVAEGALAQYGAVSEQVVAMMAEGAGAALDVDYAVAISGVAGPGGGSVDKPVGTVWFALHSRATSHTHTELRFMPGSRAAIRARATATALDLLRRAVTGLPLESS